MSPKKCRPKDGYSLDKVLNWTKKSDNFTALASLPTPPPCRPTGHLTKITVRPPSGRWTIQSVKTEPKFLGVEARGKKKKKKCPVITSE